MKNFKIPLSYIISNMDIKIKMQNLGVLKLKCNICLTQNTKTIILNLTLPCINLLDQFD